MPTNEQEQLRKHQQKWDKWNQQLKDNKAKPEEASSYAVKLIQKLGDRGEYNNAVRHFDKNVDQEVNYNQCCVCFELMMAPHKPITLFPCAHNICQLCLFEGGGQNKNQRPRIQKCPTCRSGITGHAENRNLMDLICTYTDNKTQIPGDSGDQAKQAQASEAENIKNLRMRCSILEAELAGLNRQLSKHAQDNINLQKVVSEMETEKQRNEKELRSLREEAGLICRFMREKELENKKIQGLIEGTEKKLKVVKNAFEPLQVQREKMEILEAAKLLHANK